MKHFLVLFSFVISRISLTLWGHQEPFIIHKNGFLGIVSNQGEELLPARNVFIHSLGEKLFWISTNATDICSAALYDATQRKRLTDYAFCKYSGPTMISLPWFDDSGVLNTYVKREGGLIPVLVYRDGYSFLRGKNVFDTTGGEPFVPAKLHNDKSALYDIQNRKFVPHIEYDEVLLPNHGLSIVKDAGKMGAVDCLGNLVLPIEYDDVSEVSFKSGTVSVALQGKHGLMSPNGDWLIPMQEGISFLECNSRSPIIKIKKGNSLQLYDTLKRKLLTNRRFDEIDFVAEDYFIAKNNGCWALIDKDGNDIIRSTEKLENWSPDRKPGYYVIKSGRSRFSIITKNANTVVEPASGVIAIPYERPLWLVFWNDAKRGVYSIEGEMLIPFDKWRKIACMGSSLTIATSSNDTIVISSTGEEIITNLFKSTSIGKTDLSGYARIVCDGKAGLIDGDCDFALPCLYEDVGHFGEGLVPAKHGGKWGFVELSGKWAVNPGFDGAREFKNGHAPVCMGGKWGFIGKDGKPSTPFAYEDVKDVRDGHFRAKTGGKWGIFALDGTCKLPAEYDDILADDEYGYGEP